MNIIPISKVKNSLTNTKEFVRFCSFQDHSDDNDCVIVNSQTIVNETAQAKIRSLRRVNSNTMFVFFR